jgi:RNA recognition motif-containing protein
MAEDSRKLFVAGLPDSITEDVLRQLFEATGGAVAEVTLPRDRTTGRPRGFGFVTMSTTDEANAARESLHGSFQGGRSISVRPFESAPPKREPGDMRPGAPPSTGPRSAPASQVESPDRKIYIGNLPYDATPEEVEAVVNATGGGPVVRVIMPSDPDGRKRGFAFAYMASQDAARGAIDLLKGAEVRGRRLVVNHAHDRPARDERGGGGGGYQGGGYQGGGGGFGPPSGPRSDHSPNSGRDFGPPAFAGGGGGGPPSGGRAGGPPQGRKTFDERRRKTHEDGGGARGGAGGGRKNKNDWDTRGDDWDE